MKTTTSLSLLSVLASPACALIRLPVVARNALPHDFAERALFDRSFSVDLLNNATGQIYSTTVTVGTPPQSFTLQVDTGSSDVWVVNKNANQCSSSSLQAQYGGCWGGTFDSTKSTTFNDSAPGLFSIKYGDGTGSSGDYFNDNFGIGGKTLTSIVMGLATKTTVGYGLMGVGYSTNEASNAHGYGTYPSVIEEMVSQGVITTKAYSLYLDDLTANTGSIIFGGADTGKFIGQLKTVPLIADSSGNYSEFLISMTSISYTTNDGKATALTTSTFDQPFLLDSGTGYTQFPASLVKQFISAYSATVQSNGVITLPCSAKSSFNKAYMSFQFNGAGGPTINVPMDEWIYPGDSSTCILKVSATSNTYILGDTFLRSAYIVYDLTHNEVGLAQADFESSVSNLVEFKATDPGIPTLTGQATGTTLEPKSEAVSLGKGLFGVEGVLVLAVSGLFALLGGVWALA